MIHFLSIYLKNYFRYVVFTQPSITFCTFSDGPPLLASLFKLTLPLCQTCTQNKQPILFCFVCLVVVAKCARAGRKLSNETKVPI